MEEKYKMERDKEAELDGNTLSYGVRPMLTQFILEYERKLMEHAAEQERMCLPTPDITNMLMVVCVQVATMKPTNNKHTESPLHQHTLASPLSPVPIPSYEHTIVETQTLYVASFLLRPLNQTSPRPLQWSVIIRSAEIIYPRLLGISMVQHWAAHRLVVGIIIKGAQQHLIRLRPVACWALPA